MQTTSDEKISAVILAAGRSIRMGLLKPLLPLCGQTIIERVIGLFRQTGISDILVVVGHQAESITPLLKKQGIRWAVNDHYDEGMFSSIQTGVKSLSEKCPAFFLIPADMPFVLPSTVMKLKDAYYNSNMDICHPCHGKRRGHPPLISAALIPSILAFPEPGGMRTLLHRFEATSMNVACDDPGILIDMDTPDDYERAKKRFI